MPLEFDDDETLVEETDLIKAPSFGEVEAHDTHDYVILPDGSTPMDVESGIPYFAEVNNTKPFGIFVTLARRGPHDDVNGLIHESGLPLGTKPEKFEQGDEVVVQLFDRTDKGLNFQLVAILDSLRGLSSTKGAPLRDFAERRRSSEAGRSSDAASSRSTQTNGVPDSDAFELSAAERKMVETIRDRGVPASEVAGRLGESDIVAEHCRRQMRLARAEAESAQGNVSAAARWRAYEDVLALATGESVPLDAGDE